MPTTTTHGAGGLLLPQYAPVPEGVHSGQRIVAQGPVRGSDGRPVPDSAWSAMALRLGAQPAGRAHGAPSRGGWLADRRRLRSPWESRRRTLRFR